MTPEERARLIEQYEKGLEDWDLKPFTIDESRAIISDLRRLDVLEKALRPFAEDYFSNREEAELNHMETRHHGGVAYDACVYFEDVQKAKQALGDA